MPTRRSSSPTTANSGCRQRCSPRTSPGCCRLSSTIDVGVLHINSESAGADPHVPFGGAKKSGLGPKEQGSAAREFFTHTTTVYLRGGAAARMNPGALDGLVVVDFSRVLAGPYATMMLGDFGADVIKIERPQVGDDTREWGPPYDSEGVATYFNAVNRNKRSVVLDLTDPADRQRARELVATADIVVENFRAGTMEKLGLGYDDLRASKPDLIYCSITGFGRDGGAALPGYDLLVQAVGGLMSVTGPGPGEPTKVGVALVDVLAGLHALVGILAALAHRDRTGRRPASRHQPALGAAVVTGQSGIRLSGRRRGARHHGQPPPEHRAISDVSPPPTVPSRSPSATTSSSGRSPPRSVCPGWPTTPGSRPTRSGSPIAMPCPKLLDPVLKADGADHWYAELTAVGVPAGPINDLAEAFTFARGLGIEATVTVPGSPTPQVANPVTLSATPVTYRNGPPRLGDSQS